MRNAVILILGIWVAGSCTPSDEIITGDPFQLSFSQDTVLFDTLFTTIKSITRRFKVYNPGERAVKIDWIRLAEGPSSSYRLILNGLKGVSFSDHIILGKDSLQILVEANIDTGNQNNPFLVKDSIIFETGSPQKDIKLIAWGQDANYLKDSILSGDQIWENDKPYVLLGSVLVDSTCTLTIDPGTQIYSGFNSTLFIQGSLIVNGNSENKVIFRNDRRDEGFNDAPGQWEGIYFLEGSTDNTIEHAEIFNSQYGIWLGTPDTDTIPDLELRSTSIYNISRTGLIAFTSDLYAENLLIHTCGEQSVANLAGGNYSYNHCTLVNYPTRFFRDEALAVFSDNIQLADNSIIVEDISVEIINSIIFGPFTEELILNNGGGANFELAIGYNILKTQNIELDINNNILNIDPGFLSIEESDYSLRAESPAIDSGLPTTVSFDIEGALRDSNPDIGAYEFHE